MAIHSDILAWRIPWTDEPGGLRSMGLQRVRHDWATHTQPTHPHACYNDQNLTLISCFSQSLPFPQNEGLMNGKTTVTKETFSRLQRQAGWQLSYSLESSTDNQLEKMFPPPLFSPLGHKQKTKGVSWTISLSFTCGLSCKGGPTSPQSPHTSTHQHHSQNHLLCAAPFTRVSLPSPALSSLLLRL